MICSSTARLRYSRARNQVGAGWAMAKNDGQFDWVFDFALQFLESDKFDAAVMDFVDEKCDVFDSDDENKFVYSDIHQEFRDYIEHLITSNLGELGITPTMFYESCEKGRHSRDINRAVFERLLSMEDFDTFKRIMVKRNMELQIEALTSYDAISPVKAQASYTPQKKRNPGMKIMPTIDSPFTEEEERSQLEEALAASLRGPGEPVAVRASGGPSADDVSSFRPDALLTAAVPTAVPENRLTSPPPPLPLSSPLPPSLAARDPAAVPGRDGAAAPARGAGAGAAGEGHRAELGH